MVGITGSLAEELEHRIRIDSRRIVVLDDDPTGTQTISDTEVVLTASGELLDEFFASDRRVLYILTNTRASPQSVAIDILLDIVGRVEQTARRHELAWVAILRGDSTLRGHVFAEVDALGGAEAVTLFVPAFPEGGRVTRSGQQLVTIDGRLQNVADTEFAQDHTFGYTSRDLTGWVREVGGGRLAQIVPLRSVREAGPEAITTILQHAPRGSVVIPEVENIDDLRRIALALLAVESSGTRVVVRCAASFMAVRSGLVSRRIDRVQIDAPGRILVACGSYARASTEQLEALSASGVAVRTVGGRADDPIALELIISELDREHIVGIATPREVLPDADLRSGQMFIDSLQAVVLEIADHVDAIVAKGGITSAELARALGSGVALVEGQFAPGVSVWKLDLPNGRSLPFIVVPGNVGDRNTLVDLVSRLVVNSDSVGLSA